MQEVEQCRSNCREVGFKDRFDDELHRHLRDPVADGWYSQRTQTAIRLGNHDAPYRLGLVGFVPQVLGQFQQKRFYPDSALDGLEAHSVNAGTASVGTDKSP